MEINTFLTKLMLQVMSAVVHIILFLHAAFYAQDFIPKLTCRDSDLTKHLIKRSGLLSKAFRPPLLLKNGYIQTLVGYFCKHLGDVEFEREHLQMNNRGTVAIDWFTKISKGIRKNSPILVIFPRLTGDAVSVGYICRLAAGKGFRVVVFNRRGHGSTLLTSPKLTSAGDPIDAKQVIEYIQCKYPDVTMAGVGYGAGCATLLSYMGEYGSASLLKAVVCISPSYANTEKLCQHIPKFYELFVLLRMKMMLLRYSWALRKLIDMNAAIFKSWNLAEFDYHVYCRMYGIEHFETFWEKNNPLRSVDHISVPVLCINSLDDPVCKDFTIPYEVFRMYPYLLLLTIAKGGHCAFHENFNGVSWADNTALTYIEGVLDFSSSYRFWYR